MKSSLMITEGTLIEKWHFDDCENVSNQLNHKWFYSVVWLRFYSKFLEKCFSYFDHHFQKNSEKNDTLFESPNIDLLESG